MKNHDKKLLHDILKRNKKTDLMQRLHNAFGIDFDKQIEVYQWGSILTEKSLANAHGTDKTLYLLIERLERCTGLRVVVYKDGKFMPRSQDVFKSCNVCYESYWCKKDFEQDRKEIGKDVNVSKCKCYVLNPTAYAKIKDKSEMQDNIADLIRNRLVRATKYRTVDYMDGSFCHHYNVHVGYNVECKLHFEEHFDKSGYLLRKRELIRKAEELKRRKDKDVASNTSFDSKITAAEESLEQIKATTIELIDFMCKEPNWSNKSLANESLYDLYHSVSYLSDIKDHISRNDIPSVEWANIRFDAIKKIAEKNLK